MILVHRGPCSDILEYAPSIDFVCVDPPYSEYVHSNAVTAGMLEYGEGVRKRDFGFEHLTPELRAEIQQFVRECQGWSAVYSDFESAHEWFPNGDARRDPRYVRSVPWIRWSQPQKSGDRPPQGWEIVLLFHRKGRKRWNGPGSLIAFDHESLAYELLALDHKSLRGSDKHPTEKPLDQALELVSWFSQPGQLVSDPCCGRGGVALACRLLGRDFVGADPLWGEQAEARALGAIDERDYERAWRYVEGLVPPATVERPEKNSQLRTWERAKRREADVERVRAALAVERRAA